jgi:hypothetical protein
MKTLGNPRFANNALAVERRTPHLPSRIELD